MSKILHPDDRSNAEEIDLAIARLKTVKTERQPRGDEAPKNLSPALPPDAQSLKNLVGSLPVVGSLLRWGWSLASITKIKHEAHLARQEAKDLANQVSLLKNELRMVRLQQIRGEGTNRSENQQILPASVYLQLENELRGPQESIEKKQTAYEGYAHQAARLNLPLVDLGCGRGEWLASLKKFSIPLIGIEQNEDMLETCRSKGLAVIQADLVDWLEAQPPNSLGLITAFQVVEHLTAASLWKLLEHAYRVLSPGGFLILETPNPENIQVASYSFWLDPTHKSPIPPPLLSTLAKISGFQVRDIIRSAPYPEFEQSPEQAELIHKMLFCEQDYALVAQK